MISISDFYGLPFYLGLHRPYDTWGAAYDASTYTYDHVWMNGQLVDWIGFKQAGWVQVLF